MSKARNFFKKISDRLLLDREDLKKSFGEAVCPRDVIEKDSDRTPKVKEKEQSYYRDKNSRWREN
jgi:hypothetical protein